MNYAGKFGSGGLDPVSGVDIDLGPLSPHGHLSSPGKVHVDKISTHAPSDAIIIPDAHLLFHGDFKRSGVDLILSDGDRELLLRDYFKGEKRPALASPDGAHLTGDLVNALSGHTQFAQADGSASVAPQMIGHVTKLVGSATAIRNGVSIILNQGDTVHKGDVVQSGSDSTLGITFIDGTVFGLASNAKMVLNEMVYDPNGSDNKSLLSLVQGTISFVAGATAKKGDMKVDTPVATMGIRGTAVLVEIDFEVPGSGSAPPAKFQVLVEPDGTTGSYILFDKTTLTPIATVSQAGTQTIINGQGAVSFSSSVQLSPDAQKIISDVFSLKFTDLNSPNTKLTTNFTDSIIPQSTFLKLASNDFIPVTLQVVNVPDKPVAPPSPGPSPFPDHIPGPPQAVAHGGSLAERIDITGSVVVDSVSGKISYADVNPTDVPSVKAAFSSFLYADAQGANVTATLTAEQLAAIKAVEVPLSVVQDPNGKNTGTATWTYTIADGAFDFLADGEKLTLTYMARVDNNYAPANETTFVPFTIVITGTNDKPTLTSTGGAITERIGTGNAAMDVATGTVTFADTDLTDKPVVSTSFSDFKFVDADGNDITAELTPEQLAAIALVEIPLTVVQTAGNSNKGTATWTYSIADSAFDFLAKGETLTLNYVAEVDDGHGGVVRTPISVSINGADIDVVGTNDDPTITTTSNAFTERANGVQPNPTGSPLLDIVSGTIGFTDVDLTDRPLASAAFNSFTYRNASDVDVTSSLSAAQLAAIIAVEKPLSVVQTAGNTNDGSATWTYSAADGAFDFLADGERLTLTYLATVDDGHGGVVSKPLTVTVTGTNDSPSIVSGPQAATIAERADTSGSTTPDTAGGSVTFKDADLTDTHDVTINGVSASGDVTGLANGAIQLGWLSLGTLADSTGGVTGSKIWSFSAPDSYFDYLADGDAVTLTYTVQIDDHHGGTATQDIVVTVTGTNDAPSILSEVDPPVQTVNVLAPIVLAPGANDNSLGLVSETFDSLPSGSFASIGAGFGNFYSAILDATFSATDDAGLVNGLTAPFSTIQFGPLPATQDTTNYLVVGTVWSAETITFNAEKNAFGLYWGTLDGQNQIYFYNDTSLVASYTGADLMPLFASGNRGNLGSDGYVEFLGLPLFDKVVLTGGFFESDNIVAGNIPAPTPGLSGPVKGTLSVYDGDIGDTLTAFVTGNATIEYNGSPSVPGNVDISALIDPADIKFDSAPSNGGTALLNWTYQPTNANLGFLNVGDVLKITYVAEVSDGYGNFGSQPLSITLVGANGATTASASLVSASLVGGPVIGTDALTVTENADGTKKVSGLYLSDNDATAPNDTFTIGAVAEAADAGVTPSAGKGSLAAVNAALDSGVTYDPGSNPPQTDMVTLTVSDGFGHSDTVHFVFNEAGDGPVILNGTSGKDVIFATGADDTLTGGASADQFVFAPEPNPSTDTITDFAPGEDRIDLRLFAGVVDVDNVDGWLAANAVQSSTSPADVLITLGNDTLTLKNVAIANMHASDFIVSPHHVGA